MEDRFRFIKDTGLKYIGKTTKQKYMFALFECPYCKNNIETRKTIGLKQICCKKCYRYYRKGKNFGAIKEKVKISGYLYILKPNHPNCNKRKYVAEHRLIAEKYLGRYLTNNEIVHHINEIKTDNRKENLEIMTKKEHMQLHRKDTKRGKNGQFKI